MKTKGKRGRLGSMTWLAARLGEAVNANKLGKFRAVCLDGTTVTVRVPRVRAAGVETRKERK